MDAITKGRVALTVVQAGGSTHQLAIRTLRRVHEAFPQHPLIAWCDLRTMVTHELLEVARSGVQEIVRDGFDELRHTFSVIMASASQRAVGAQISHQLSDIVPSRVQPLLEYALEHASDFLDREAFAAVFGVTGRTVQTRLSSCGLPPTRAFLTWCRLLVASALLDQPGHTLDTVAEQIGFSEGHHLGNTFKRYAGQSVNGLRDGGALASTAAAFRSCVADRTRVHRRPDSLPAPSVSD